MFRIGFLFALLGFLNTSIAHTSGEVDFVCPIEGNKFKCDQDFSGTSFGARLDLKKIGPIAQPWSLPDCPKCHFVIYSDEIEGWQLKKLKPFILSEAYQKHSKNVSYERLAIIQEFLALPAFDIGWSYLQASWQCEDDKPNYERCLQSALASFEKAATSTKADQKNPKTDLLSRYLPIEILRRLSRFEEARAKLDSFPETYPDDFNWLYDVIPFQKELTSKKDSSIHQISDALKNPKKMEKK